MRQQFTASEPADGDNRQSTTGFDPEFGTLAGQPELVQVDEYLAQAGGVESIGSGRSVSWRRVAARSVAATGVWEGRGPAPESSSDAGP